MFLNMLSNMMKILVFILFASTATVFTQNADSSTKYDITTLLNQSIARTFQNMDPKMIEQLILSIQNHTLSSYETEINYDYKPFQNEFYFTSVNITILKLGSVHVRHEFSRDQMTIFSPKMSIKIEGYLGATNDTVHAGFIRSVDFENISIVAFKLSQNLPDRRLQVFIKYDEDFESNYIYSPWFHQDLIPEAQQELERKIRQLLPALFVLNLQHNENFMQTLNTTFCNHPEKYIESVYPNFQQNKEQYSYFIPNITSLGRTLSNITIQGLWNFQSHSFSTFWDETITTLIIKNIRGNTNLYYGTPNSTIFPLEFEIGCISILIDGQMQRISVNTFNYSVTQTNLNVSLSKHQSKWVMEGLELAIASSIMPSTKLYRDIIESSSTYAQHPIVKISTTLSEQFEGSKIQKLYENWNISAPQNLALESSLQLGSSNYTISIYDIPMRALTPYPEWIDCNLYNHLRLSFGIPLYLIGKLSLSNSTHIFEDIDFMLGDIFVGVIKRNNSNENDDYEFTTNLGINVELSSNQYNFTEDQCNVIQKKIQEMMISSIEQILSVFTKPLLSLPLDFCTAPVKLFDDFLPFLADYELPYYVPDRRPNTDKFFASKINNVVITEWANLPTSTISFYSDGTSMVSIQLGAAKVRMSFNDTSVQSDDLEFVFPNFLISNCTDNGDIDVHLNYDNRNYSIGNNVTLSARDSFWLKEKLEYFLAASFKNLTKN